MLQLFHLNSIAIVLAAIYITASNALTSYITVDRVLVEFGQNIGAHVRSRVLMHLRNIKYLTKLYVLDDLLEPGVLEDITKEDDGGITRNATLLLSLGNASLSLSQISPQSLSQLEHEGFKVILRKAAKYGCNFYTLSSNGLPLSDHTHKNISFNRLHIHYGAVLGTYAALELLGFAFLHPLDPYIPSYVSFRVDSDMSHDCGSAGDLNVIEENPYWPERGFHLHTQHPLELTEVLQGHDIPQFGPHGPHCKRNRKVPRRNKSLNSNSSVGNTIEHPPNVPTGLPYCERWEDMIENVDYFFEWSIANRLNKVEWLLLSNFKWGDELATRQNRMRRLTHLGHQYSLLIGADSPIGNIQQHGWHMVNVRLPIKQQILQIQERVDWIFNANFDFLTTESGLSEFTHPECDLMVELLNAFAIYVNVTWGREAAIKVHCSTGQKCNSYLDPRTGDPINFNFLPTLAHSGLGVFPHTVQVYALDDPSAGTYGNNNFSYVEDYLVYEAKQKKRSVMFYGETSYWVNVDIDVPLFLPIYGQRRQRDLRRIAHREKTEDFRMDGQMNFDSGWEWGYWLSDVVTARSSWDPKMSVIDSSRQRMDDSASSVFIDEDEWTVFGKSIDVYTSIYGEEFGTRLNNIIVSLAKVQVEVLIRGKVNGEESPDLSKLSGMAYLSGWDTWTDIPRWFGVSMTQPDKIHLMESSDPLWPRVLELVKEMDKVFHSVSIVTDKLFEDVVAASVTSNFINDQAIELLSEINDSIKMLWLRSRQVRLLYEAREAELDSVTAPNYKLRNNLLHNARNIIMEATDIVHQREIYYRVNWERIASWRENPTVYRYGYLWAVHSLYYWWRDQGIAEQGSAESQHSICYLNRIDSTEVAVGWGKYTLELLRKFIRRYTPFASLYPLEIFNCLSSPSREYQFPQDLHYLRA